MHVTPLFVATCDECGFRRARACGTLPRQSHLPRLARPSSSPQFARCARNAALSSLAGASRSRARITSDVVTLSPRSARSPAARRSMMPVSASKRETVTRCAVLPCSRWGFAGGDGALNRRAAARRLGICGVAMRVLYRAERRVQCGLNAQGFACLPRPVCRWRE